MAATRPPHSLPGGSDPPIPSVARLTELGIRPRFAVMTEAMDSAADRLRHRLAPLQAAAVAFVIRRAWEALRRRDPEALAALDLSTDREVAAFRDELRHVYGVGRREALREIAGQGPDPAPVPAEEEERAEEAIAALALVFAARLADRLRTGASVAAATQLAAGDEDRARLEADVTAAPESLLRDFALQAAAIGLAMGRWAAIAANRGLVDMVIYTTAMDGRVCAGCRPYEGREYRLDDAALPSIPNPACEGRSRCRCALIPVTRQAAP